MPGAPVSREQADRVGRVARRAGTRAAALIVAGARSGGRASRSLSRSIAAMPAALRHLILAGLLTLCGIVGALTLHNTAGLVCIVVVVPVCAMVLGALGQRWYSGSGLSVTGGANPETSTNDARRSLEYVDKKLTGAFNAFGADRNQHAMIALFQAKTAIELTLGTEQDAESSIDAWLAADDHAARPRIRAGSASRVSLAESNSLAAS